MATYSTDLTTATDAASGTWTEFGSANSGGSPGSDTENYIQGVECRSQTTGTKFGSANPKSVVYNHGSDLASGWTSGHAFFTWLFYAVGSNIDTYASDGYQVGVGADTTNVDRFTVSGSDYGRNPYGGWFCPAVDPEQTATNTYGTGGAGYQYIGGIVYTLAAISKGTPHAVDAVRYGRGEISIIGTGGTFSELAEYNDYNAGGTPPGTSSTSVDSGRHRLGLFQAAGGVYLWKGLMSLGTASTITFTDSNETILVEDCPNTYAAFNKIEVANASSSVTWTNVTITATGTVAPGDFEMLADATVAWTGCSFNGMGTFILDSNFTGFACTWNGCGLITLNEGNISGSSILESTVAADTGAVHDNRTTSSPTTISELDNCTFTQGTNDHHAIDFGTGVTDDITLTGIEFTGFDETTGEDQPGAALRFLATSGSLTCNLVNCTVGGAGASATNFFKDDAAGIAVTLAFDTITLSVTVLDYTDDTPLTTATVQLLKDSDKSVLLSGAVNGSGVISDSIAYDTDTDVVGWAREHNMSGTDYTQQDFSGEYTSNGFSIVIRLVPAE